MSSNLQPKLSICVPTYNGFPYVRSLIDELLRSPRSDFEIVISDDGSTDGTWEFISQKSTDDPRVKAFRNGQNLGMDANFAKTVSLADGRYVWLCGQDDKLFHEGIEAVVTMLEEQPDLDFVYLNHIKVLESDEQDSSLDRPEHGNHHVYGHGLNEYLKHHNYELPTFLPKYIIRKDLWDSVDVSKYFGTYYCQVGVFLEVSHKLNWCHLDGNYVIGLTPIKGWQSDPEQFTRISLGICSMLLCASHNSAFPDQNILRKLINKNYKRLIMSYLLIRSHAVLADKKTIHSAMEAIRVSPSLNTLIKLIMIMPDWVASGLLRMNELRRNIRKNVLGIVPQGPKVD